MTTMTPPTATPPPPPPGPPAAGPPTRRLTRSSSDKVAGGVAGGLGEYFALDPVLFRVLFAVAAFFGGFGLVAYAVLWFALPEAGDTQTSPVDRLGGWLRAHNVPLWLAGVVGVVGLWVLFGGFGGWWGHGAFFPGAAVIGVVLLVVAFSRRGATGTPPAPPVPPTGPGSSPADAGAPTVSLTKPYAAVDDDAVPADPTATTELRATSGPTPSNRTEPRPMDEWYREARERGKARRRRARPLFLATLGATVLALGVVGIIDAVHGVALPVYALVGGGVVLLGLLAGIVARRPAFSLLWFLVPALVWLFAFGGTHVSLRDGVGDVAYRPTSAGQLEDDYRLAFGRVTLDLTQVYAGGVRTGMPSTVTVRVGAGAARVVVPRDADVTVIGQVRAGTTVADGRDAGEVRGSGGWRTTTRVPATGTEGPPLTVVLQVTDGAALVDHVGS